MKRLMVIAPGWPMEHLIRLAHNRASRDSRVFDVGLHGLLFGGRFRRLVGLALTRW
jgi:hypothetical protein